MQLATTSACIRLVSHRRRNSAKGQGHSGRPDPPLSRTMLGQMGVTSWPAATQPRIEPGSVVTPLGRPFNLFFFLSDPTAASIT
jgi:hypothetical protein